MATAHINSKLGEIASIVLMPGDPRRAKYIADNYLDNVEVVNEVRGMLAYTGEYKGKRITVFPSGMGIPSMGIYSYELFNYYNVDTIIRIGTIGAYDEKLKLGDVVIADRVYSDSSFAKVQIGYNKNYFNANKSINNYIEKTAQEMNLNYVKGNIFSSDVFYNQIDRLAERRSRYNVLGIEMESFGLLSTAKISNKKATIICTVSNSFCFKKEFTSEEREKNLNDMIKLALNTSLKL